MAWSRPAWCLSTERRTPLVRLSAEEAVEVLEATSACRPRVKGADGAGLPDGDFVVFAELRGGVAVEFERLRQWRRRSWAEPNCSPGAPVAISVMPAMPTEWWLRPVSNAWRVGELMRGGVETVILQPGCSQLFSGRHRQGPPKALEAPNPTSSIRMSRTLGAPFGAVTSLGNSLMESLALRLMNPPKGCSGRGRTLLRVTYHRAATRQHRRLLRRTMFIMFFFMVYSFPFLGFICLLTRYWMHSEIRARRWPSGDHRESFVNKQVFDEKASTENTREPVICRNIAINTLFRLHSLAQKAPCSP